MESKNIEYKEKITNTFLKTVSAFANYDGGIIIFGVNDAGKVLGVGDGSHESLSKLRLEIENKINDSIKPQPFFAIKISDNNTIELEVKSGENTPYMYKSKAYKRNDTATIEVDNIELNRLILKGNRIDFEEMESKNQSLTFNYLKDKLVETLAIDDLDTNILKTLNLYNETSGFNNAALLLSDQNDFQGIDVAVFGENINIIKQREIIENFSILKIFDNTIKIFNENYVYEQIKGYLREKLEIIPFEAFREAVANAIIHRTWDVNDKIRIMMFDDRIEVISPGGLPTGLSEKAYLAGDYSTLRNPILAGVLFRLNLVETFGTGIRRIKEAYSESINKPEFEVYDEMIKITLPIIKGKSLMSGDKVLIYNILSNKNGKSISEITAETPFGKSKVREILIELINDKNAYVLGNGKSTRYYKY